MYKFVTKVIGCSDDYEQKYSRIERLYQGNFIARIKTISTNVVSFSLSIKSVF